jgi:hypothetical protein
MLKDFRVTCEKRLHETERADRPSIMIAPDEKKEAGCEQGSGQKKPCPRPKRHIQCLTQFTEADDEYQHAGKVMIELGVGDACYGPVPPCTVIRSPMMVVAGMDCFMHRYLIVFIMLRP